MRYPTLFGVIFFSAASVLVLATGGALADDGKVGESIAEVDANKDGVVQPGEFPFGAYFFKLSDINGDGVLSPDEAKRVHEIDGARRSARKKNGELRTKFAKADADANGIIERAEFPADDALFQRFDRDGDAKVTWEEALAFAVEEEVAKAFAECDGDMSGTLSLAEVPEKSKAVVSAADLDRNGEVTGKEAFDFLYNARVDAKETSAKRSVSGKATQAGGDMGVLGALMASFKQLDADSDGGLTRSEFPASSELFTLMDLDRDGRLIQPELQIRLRHAKRIGERGKRLRDQIAAAGMAAQVAVAGAEIKGAFAAGRYEEVDRMLDQIELKIELKTKQAAGK